jgi:segregation and condensation protein A
MPYKVKLNFFEGPLDLLLFLIKKERIDIYDIPIAKITEQYLSYLELLELLDLNLAGEFLVMAATLMQIKSKMLLPPDEDENPDDPKDPREELVRRLLEYKKFKEAAGELLMMKERAQEVVVRKGTSMEPEVRQNMPPGKEDYVEVSLFDLISAFRKVLKNVSKDLFHQVIKDRFTVSDKIHAIYHMLASRPVLFFSTLFMAAESKDEIIVTFLAVLELIKMREILVIQNERHGEIEIVRNPEAVTGESGGPDITDEYVAAETDREDGPENRTNNTEDIENGKPD